MKQKDKNFIAEVIQENDVRIVRIIVTIIVVIISIINFKAMETIGYLEVFVFSAIVVILSLFIMMDLDNITDTIVKKEIKEKLR